MQVETGCRATDLAPKFKKSLREAGSPRMVRRSTQLVEQRTENPHVEVQFPPWLDSLPPINHKKCAQRIEVKKPAIVIFS
jgi:hypothetical protein